MKEGDLGILGRHERKKKVRENWTKTEEARGDVLMMEKIWGD